MGFIKRETKRFVTISAEGELRVPSDEKNPLAVRREYELRDGNGSKGVKYEIIQDAYDGLIKKVSISDNGFGPMLNIAFEKEEGDNEEVIISMSTESSFGMDLMRKLPNIDFNKEVELAPYSFCDDNLKDRRGITVRQIGHPDGKVQDYFFDKENKQSTNGLLAPEGDTGAYDKDDWKMYFMRVRKFLTRFTEQEVVPKVEEAAARRDLRERTTNTAEQIVKQETPQPINEAQQIEAEDPSMLEKVMNHFPNSRVIDERPAGQIAGEEIVVDKIPF